MNQRDRAFLRSCGVQVDESYLTLEEHRIAEVLRSGGWTIGCALNGEWAAGNWQLTHKGPLNMKTAYDIYCRTSQAVGIKVAK